MEFPLAAVTVLDETKGSTWKFFGEVGVKSRPNTQVRDDLFARVELVKFQIYGQIRV
jgi:hypothetical protein